jgi:hypothetical protein
MFACYFVHRAKTKQDYKDSPKQGSTNNYIYKQYTELSLIIHSGPVVNIPMDELTSSHGDINKL